MHPCTSLKPYMNDILNLPILQQTGKELLTAILHHSIVRPYKKGETICTCGDKTEYFFVVLSGMVKLLKNNDAGQEVIFRIAKHSEPIIENYTHAAYCSTVQAVADTSILQIPIHILHQHHQDAVFQTHLLKAMQESTHHLINQIEQLTLKSATQRLGWFLLKLVMEQQDSKEKQLKLPYDKSLIAEHLGMRPETFSRTIKQMKAYGIDIKNKNLVLKDSKALCEFCTAEIASRCPTPCQPY